jgi:hypothetical protein
MAYRVFGPLLGQQGEVVTRAGLHRYSDLT